MVLALRRVVAVRGEVDALAELFLDAVVTINDFIYTLPEDLGPESWIALGSFDVNGALAAEERVPWVSGSAACWGRWC